MRLKRISSSSIPNTSTLGAAAAKISCSTRARPFLIGTRPPSVSKSDSVNEASRKGSRSFVVLTSSINSCLATALRVSLPRMSSRRDCALRSSRSRKKYCNGSTIRQRANRSTAIYSLSLVGMLLGAPSHSRIRFSTGFTCCMNGTLNFRPASVLGSPTGLPN